MFIYFSLLLMLILLSWRSNCYDQRAEFRLCYLFLAVRDEQDFPVKYDP